METRRERQWEATKNSINEKTHHFHYLDGHSLRIVIEDWLDLLMIQIGEKQ